MKGADSFGSKDTGLLGRLTGSRDARNQVAERKVAAGMRYWAASIAPCIGIGLLLAGCDSFVMSPRAEVVKSMESAICRDRNMRAAEPYVTEASKPVLQLVVAAADLAQIFQKNALADLVAAECHNWKFRLIEEIKVDEGRYILRTGEQESRMQEFVVVRENGEWKVALSGK